MIGSIGGIGISSYIFTRTSTRDGDTPPVDPIGPVETSQQDNDEIDWTQASSMLSSSGAVVQRLSLLLAGEGRSLQSASDSQSREETLRRSAENAGRPDAWNPSVVDEESDDSPRSDPISRLVDVITERARGIAFAQQWSKEQLAVLTEVIQQFRGDVRQAAQSFDPRSARRDDLIEQIDDAFSRLNRSFQIGGPTDPGEDESDELASVEDALTDSPIPPDTLRAAFTAELANLRMTLSEMDSSGQPRPQSAGDVLQIERYRTMERQRLEQWREDLYRPQLNAVA